LKQLCCPIENRFIRREKMPATLLYPSYFGEKGKVDEFYEDEFNAASSLPEFRTAFYDHDRLVDEPSFVPKFHPSIEPGLCVGRMWMMKPEEYKRFADSVEAVGGKLINSFDEYCFTHMFPNVYPLLEGYTPRILVFKDGEPVSAPEANERFKRFIIKDFVKSVKGHDFPAFVDTPISQAELDKLIERFIDLRQPLFTGGIVFKEFVNLKRYEGKTNECRAFYMYGKVLSVSKNSGQPESAPLVPMDLAKRFANIPSSYYTIDFGELDDGTFTILETGDGQVSGLPSSLSVPEYYGNMKKILKSKSL
jgi:hypothetical protein